MMLQMARLTADADYDAGETSGNVPRPRSYSGNDHACNRLRTSRAVKEASEADPLTKRLLNNRGISPSLLS
ncbi:unnamed protein product [Protopolystoma xenopodis]|uniref:Uncharacterized protein n=1 Tax=Protopolystoma xenopodis TaxID=117903 RepID=A0A3S5FGP4_9PLAT|nr:unnamed protein product [Protopolystoma xenopodis]